MEENCSSMGLELPEEPTLSSVTTKDNLKVQGDPFVCLSRFSAIKGTASLSVSGNTLCHKLGVR